MTKSVEKSHGAKLIVASLALVAGIMGGSGSAQAQAFGAEQGSAALTPTVQPSYGRTEARFETAGPSRDQLRTDSTAGAEQGSAALSSRLTGRGGSAAEAHADFHRHPLMNPTTGAERGSMR